LVQATRSVPIVFTIVVDPLGSGFVNNLARPGGNVTGFMLFEYSLSGKWLDLLKQIAPDMRRVAVIRDPSIASGTGQFAVIQGVAPALGLEVTVINIRDRAEMERAVSAFAGLPNGGLVVTAGPLSTLNQNLITALAAKYKLPTVYPLSLLYHRRGTDLVRTKFRRPGSAHSRVRRPYPQRGKTRRPPCADADQVRTCD